MDIDLDIYSYIDCAERDPIFHNKKLNNKV